MRARGEGCGGGKYVNCGAEVPAKNLPNNPIPEQLAAPGEVAPGQAVRSSLVLRVLGFPFPQSSLMRLAGLGPGQLRGFLHHEGDSLPDTSPCMASGDPL